MFGIYPAAILAVVLSLLITGGLHEDGLTDACDGFSGGKDTKHKLMLRKRFVIAMGFEQLNNISQIGHSRHRSVTGFMLHLMAGLLAYTFQTHQLSLNLSDSEDKGIALMQCDNF